MFDQLSDAGQCRHCLHVVGDICITKRQRQLEERERRDGPLLVLLKNDLIPPFDVANGVLRLKERERKGSFYRE